jgi:hypothetical protein
MRIVAQASLPVGQQGVSPDLINGFFGRQDARRPHTQDGCAPFLSFFIDLSEFNALHAIHPSISDLSARKRLRVLPEEP